MASGNIYPFFYKYIPIDGGSVGMGCPFKTSRFCPDRSIIRKNIKRYTIAIAGPSASKKINRVYSLFPDEKRDLIFIPIQGTNYIDYVSKILSQFLAKIEIDENVMNSIIYEGIIYAPDIENTDPLLSLWKLKAIQMFVSTFLSVPCLPLIGIYPVHVNDPFLEASPMIEPGIFLINASIPEFIIKQRIESLFFGAGPSNHFRKKERFHGSLMGKELNKKKILINLFPRMKELRNFHGVGINDAKFTDFGITIKITIPFQDTNALSEAFSANLPFLIIDLSPSAMDLDCMFLYFVCIGLNFMNILSVPNNLAMMQLKQPKGVAFSNHKPIMPGDNLKITIMSVNGHLAIVLFVNGICTGPYLNIRMPFQISTISWTVSSVATWPNVENWTTDFKSSVESINSVLDEKRKTNNEIEESIIRRPIKNQEEMFWTRHRLNPTHYTGSDDNFPEMYSTSLNHEGIGNLIHHGKYIVWIEVPFDLFSSEFATLDITFMDLVKTSNGATVPDGISFRLSATKEGILQLEICILPSNELMSFPISNTVKEELSFYHLVFGLALYDDKTRIFI